MPAKPSAKPAARINPREEAFQAAVQAAFPEIFDDDQPKPLVVGVHRQLKAAIPDASMTLVRAFLRRWTKRSAYLQALARSQHRVGLLDEVTEPIDPDHQKQALEELDKRRSKARPKRPKTQKRARPPLARGNRAPRDKTRPGVATPGRPAPSMRTPKIVVKKRRTLQPV